MKKITSEDNKVLKELLNGVDVVNFIDYQDGTVVSKMLLNKNGGNVTLFSFDEGEGLSEHTAPFDALIYVIEGEADIVISKKSHVLKAGQVVLMPANAPHALKALKRFKMLLILIKA